MDLNPRTILIVFLVCFFSMLAFVIAFYAGAGVLIWKIVERITA